MRWRWIAVLVVGVATGAGAKEKIDINNPKDVACALLGATAYAADKGRDKGVAKKEVVRQLSHNHSIRTNKDLNRLAVEVVDFVYDAGRDGKPNQLAVFIRNEWCMQYVDAHPLRQ